MNILSAAIFKNYDDLISFVNKHEITKEDIQQITFGRYNGNLPDCVYTLFYWTH